MRMFHKLKQVEACLVRIDIPKLHTASQSAVIRICFARDKIKKKRCHSECRKVDHYLEKSVFLHDGHALL